MRHHAFANNLEKDPDIYTQADGIWGAMKQAWLSTQPDYDGGLQSGVLEDNPKKDRLMLEAFWVLRIAWVAMAVLAWSGYALELLVLWWLPRHIAIIYTIVTLAGLLIIRVRKWVATGIPGDGCLPSVPFCLREWNITSSTTCFPQYL